MAASGSGSHSDRDAGAVAGAGVLENYKYLHLNAECGDISASQKAYLARAPFIGCGGGEEEEAAVKVFSAPPVTQQDLQQRRGQSQRGQAGARENGITMTSLPFTQTLLSPTASPTPPQKRLQDEDLIPRVEKVSKS